jgi:hypothetical protein
MQSAMFCVIGHMGELAASAETLLQLESPFSMALVLRAPASAPN